MSFLLYGANGYTGRLVAREAVARGHSPTLSGRNRPALEAMAAEFGNLPVRAVSLDDSAGLDAVLRDHRVVVHCAGPFSHTASPMSEACLRTGAHYLDITGEIAVFEMLASRHAAAVAAGMVLLPGVGFDVVPTDCLAAHLARRLQGATWLTLAFQTRGGMSRGTALTTLEGAGQAGAVRRDGRIIPVPRAWRTRTVDFGEGPRTAVTIPWGDVATAWHSTGIPNIEVYLAMPRRMIRRIKQAGLLSPILNLGPVKQLLAASIRRRLSGPSDEARANGATAVWGEVMDPAGRRAAARLDGPEGYTFTAHAAVRAAERVLAGEVRPGFQTPSKAFGPDFVLDIPGVKRIDL